MTLSSGGSGAPGRRPLVDGNYTIAKLFGGGGSGGGKKGAESRMRAHTLFLPASSRQARPATTSPSQLIYQLPYWLATWHELGSL
jgi:hypothetical protein